MLLAEKGKNHFEVLPENWVQVTHNSGMPIYLHKPTRVCTLAKPYFLGPGSARVSTCDSYLLRNFLDELKSFYRNTLYQSVQSLVFTTAERKKKMNRKLKSNYKLLKRF